MSCIVMWSNIGMVSEIIGMVLEIIGMVSEIIGMVAIFSGSGIGRK